MTGNEPMRRTPGVNYDPISKTNVLDFVADYGYHSIDAGVSPDAVVQALREAADEIEAEYQEVE